LCPNVCTHPAQCSYVFGERRISGISRSGIGLNVQAAYAATNHIGIIANYMYANYNDNEEDRGRKHRAGEIGLGYYNNFNERWYFEMFAGYGLGKGHAFDSSYFMGFKIVREAIGQYQKIFIQTSIGKNRGDLTWTISTKISYIDFTRAHVVVGDEQLWAKRAPTAFCSLIGNVQTPVWRKKIFIRYQGGFNFHISKEPVYDYDPVVASIGLLIKLNQKNKDVDKL